MSKFRYLLLLLIINTIFIFPLSVFAEGENPTPDENLILNIETSQNSSLLSTQTTSTTGDVAATNNGKISGYVWNDANKDGIFQTETEKPISGISVYLYNYGNAMSSTTTVATGDFSFTGLASSNYEIIISSNNFGAGSEVSPKFNWNTSSKNNNFSKKSNDASSWTSGIITLSSGETKTNFGLGAYDPTRLEAVTHEHEAENNTNPKTADETLYAVPIIGIIGAIGMFVFSRRKIHTI
ncbi:MAG: hypothetical protein K0R71_1575 [Bacillales bacterium]|jgi:hypothetical protein|nr:hypothetical protein [Bacillales bacterium]